MPNFKKNICNDYVIIILMPCTAARPSYNVQDKRVSFPEKYRFYSDLQHWADIKRFIPGALIR
jgi:hypothetical protein